MTIDQNLSNMDNQGLVVIDDSSALAEIQKAFEQIDQIQNAENPSEELSNEGAAPLDDAPDELLEAEYEDNEVLEPQDAAPKKETKSDTSDKSDKYRKLQKDKYRALTEKVAAEERIKELEHQLSESLNAGTYHYSKNAYAELDRAKVSKKKALEEVDADALIEADIALHKALATINELEKWAPNPNKPLAPSTANYDSAAKIKEEIAFDWLDSHPYLQPSSRNYNGELAAQVTKFVNHLDDNLRRMNQTNLYYSPEYFSTIDNYIDSLSGAREEPKVRIPTVGDLPPVGGVRNSYNAGPTSSTKKATQTITLNADEKILARNSGITEEDWIKYKLELDPKGRKRV